MSVTPPFPDSEIGRHLEWYFEVRVRGTATPEEIDAHFAPEYRWGWGSPREAAALKIWFDRWRAMRARVEAVEQLESYRYVVTTRLDTGVVARVWFDMEDEPAHRILRTATSEYDPSEGPVDFGAASAVVTTEGRREATVPGAFTTAIGPFGGYLAALAVRAGAVHTDKSVPISMSGHFLNAGRAGAVAVDGTSLRSSSRLESMRVRLAQRDVTLFEGLVLAGEPEPGPSHVLRTAPAVPAPAEAAERHPNGPMALFGGAMEAIPIGEEGAAAAAWVRLNPRSQFGDAWIDAARLLLPIDWLAVGASVWSHQEGRGMLVPATLDVSVAFYNHSVATDWLLCRAESPIGGAGVATSTATVWSDDGRLLALATLQMLHRTARAH